MKSKMKFEIAMAAGMSSRTFSRWVHTHREELKRLGVSKKQQLLPPKAVSYICYELGIHEEDFAA